MISFFKELLATFYSAPFYAALVHKGRGIGFKYILTCAVLGLIAIGLSMGAAYPELVKEKESILAAMPTVTIKDGQLSIDQPSPYTVQFMEKMEGGPLKIVFDTETAETDQDSIKKRMQEEKLFLLVTKSRYYVLNAANDKLDSQDFKKVADTIISKNDWQNYGALFMNTATPSSALLFFFFFLVTYLGAGATGAILLWAAAFMMRMKLSFDAGLRLASAALVPVAFLALFLVPHVLLQALIWFGFAAFGLLAARNSKAVGIEGKIS